MKLTQTELEKMSALMKRSIKNGQLLLTVEDRSEDGPTKSTSILSNSLDTFTNEGCAFVELSMDTNDYKLLEPNWD